MLTEGMFCPSCGTQNRSDARSCLECSAALRRTVPPSPAPQPLAVELAPPRSSGPVPFPNEPPRILRKPTPLAPPALDRVPRAVSLDDDPTESAPSTPQPPLHIEPLARSAPSTPAADAQTVRHSLTPLQSKSDPQPLPLALAATVPLRPKYAPPSEADAAFDDETLAEIAAVNDAKTRARVDEPTVNQLPTRPPKAASETADAVVLRIAPMLRWLLASLVDTALALGVGAAVLYALLNALDVRPAFQPIVDALHTKPMAVLAATATAWACGSVLVAGFCVAIVGASPGQLLTRLKTVRLDGNELSMLQALVRGMFVGLGLVAYGIGPMWALLFDRWRRGLGDLVARSVVVRRP